MEELKIIVSKPVPGRKTTYSPSAVDGKQLSIDIGGGKVLDIDFTCPEDGAAVEVALSVTDADGIYQDFVVLRPSQDKPEVEMLLYQDSEDENWTHKLCIPYTKEFKGGE